MVCKILTGDAKSMLSNLADNSVQLTITSPPYFNLRTYTCNDPREVGREKTINEYVDNLIEIFSVLYAKTKHDGLLFLNIGDCYREGVLQGIPWRVALALSDAGWILRSDIIWKKTNAMPSSVKNRPTVEHEYIFMLSKNRKYKYNQDEIREPHITFTEKSMMRGGRKHFGIRNGTPEDGKNKGNSNLHDARWDQAFHPLGRNKRTVWEIPLGKFRGAHFAVFPEKLVQLCMLAGSNQGDLVCDPFLGSGTTGVVAIKMKRSFWGCDINSEYISMANERIKNINLQEPLSLI